MNENTSKQYLILINDLAETFRSSVLTEQMFVSLFLNSDKALAKHIFETIANFLNIFIQQLS